MARADKYKDRGATLSKLNEAETQDQPVENSLQERSAQLFGGALTEEERKLLDAKRNERIRPISIMSIYPDPEQPRRAIPSTVRKVWDKNPQTIPDMLSAWWGMAQEERNEEIDLGALIFEALDDLPEAVGHLDAALFSLAGIARSIYRDGLVNPITVYEWRRNEYRIETGERRWLAHHLLYWMTEKNANWGNIHARTTTAKDPFRQASENNERSNLNAISRARQYALLVMALVDDEILPYDEFASDREFYAQVADHRIPHGTMGQLLNALGINSRSQIKSYRDLLSLTDDQWVKADDHNYSIRQCEELFSAPNNFETTKRPTPLTELDRFSLFISRNRSKWNSFGKKFRKMGAGEKRQISQMLEDEIARLQSIRDELS